MDLNRFITGYSKKTVPPGRLSDKMNAWLFNKQMIGTYSFSIELPIEYV